VSYETLIERYISTIVLEMCYINKKSSKVDLNGVMRCWRSGG